MDANLHELIHALVMVEKCNDEQKHWMEIVNKIINEMVIKDELPNTTIK